MVFPLVSSILACNNQEENRMTLDSIVDERTYRELYLTGFEIAVKEGQVKSVMSSYNLINGAYANEKISTFGRYFKRK